MGRRARRARRGPFVPRHVSRPRVPRRRSPARTDLATSTRDFELVGDTFRRFAEDRIKPVAEHVHRTNADVPEDVIAGLAEMGGFGLSVPEEYGGFAAGGESDYMGMVVATEELSRGSLGIGGSLITRPEILTRAIVRGGTEEQKRHWLPKLADGSAMVAVAVTEPDFGSNAGGVKTTAVRAPGPEANRAGRSTA